MPSARQRAAQYRASQIRTIRMMQQRAFLIEDNVDYQTVVDILDKQLASMGAETHREYRKRRDEYFADGDLSDKGYAKFDKPFGGKKQYRITDEDIKRYRRW